MHHLHNYLPTWQRTVIAAGLLTVVACAPAEQASTTGYVAEQTTFIDAFRPYCGQAFAATIVEDNQPSAAWDKPLVVHIRDCEENVIRMPLHVGDDRSRTWVLTQHPGYIDFQHYHLHEDGSADDVSPYGGQTLAAGSATMQAFPVDEASQALFIENGLDVSVTNTWTISFVDDKTMSYKLSRPGRIFEVHVDLSTPVDVPPPAWGYEQ
ncbi:MAG: hypothetical protein COA51_06630 [Idiomarina sp.]|nr:MAG: hypothetical protein COA51_06630 [Idiomarina sp.]